MADAGRALSGARRVAGAGGVGRAAADEGTASRIERNEHDRRPDDQVAAELDAAPG